MKSKTKSQHGYRFPREVISHAVWLYYRFSLSLRDVEELLAKRGITVTHETIRQWGRKFGPEYARRLNRRQGRLGDVWHQDEVFVKIGGKRHDLWRAVDQDGDVIDILVQRYRNARAAKRFFRRLLKGQGSKPWQLVTDKLRSYGAAHRNIMPSVDHNTDRYANNLAEVSHQPTRQRERQMRGFKSAGQAQRFLSVHGVIRNLFNLGRHRLNSPSIRRWPSDAGAI
ncbi:MAG: IS6 family transposase [Gemmatimonadota bacterium]